MDTGVKIGWRRARGRTEPCPVMVNAPLNLLGRRAGRNQRQSLPLYRVLGDRALDPATGRGGADLPAARGCLSPPPAAPQAKRTPFPLRFRFVPGSIPQCPADAAEASPNLVFQCSAGRREAYFGAYLRKHAFHKASNHISYSPRIFAPPRRAIHHGGFAPRQSESTNGCQSWPRYAQASGGKVGQGSSTHETRGGGDPRRPCKPDHQASQER